MIKTKTESTEHGPIDLKQFGLEPTTSSNPDAKDDFSKYFQQTTTQTTSAPLDLKQLGLDPNTFGTSVTFGSGEGNNFKQTTTTTTTTETKTTGNADLKNLPGTSSKMEKEYYIVQMLEIVDAF